MVETQVIEELKVGEVFVYTKYPGKWQVVAHEPGAFFLAEWWGDMNEITTTGLPPLTFARDERVKNVSLGPRIGPRTPMSQKKPFIKTRTHRFTFPASSLKPADLFIDPPPNNAKVLSWEELYRPTIWQVLRVDKHPGKKMTARTWNHGHGHTNLQASTKDDFRAFGPDHEVQPVFRAFLTEPNPPEIPTPDPREWDFPSW